jgi:PKD repeat protein
MDDDQSKAPKNTDDVKSTSNPQDFEMGETEEKGPKINNYMTDIRPPEPKVQEPEVNPTASAPEYKAPQPQPQQSQMGQTIGQAKVGIQPQVKRNAPNPEARKKALLGCLGFLGAIMLIFLVLSFVFIAQSGGEDPSPIAQMLGVNEGSFINGLITLVHVIFFTSSFIAFIFTMVGLFKAGMTKKDDKIGKKSSLKTSLVAGLLLVLILIIWVFVYMYLDGKRVLVAGEIKDPIITEPEETLNLTAPIEIKFDASNAPIDKNKYKVVFYEWDFGDGEKGTNMVTKHTYEKKGKFDVIVKITLEEKSTAEETSAEYGVTVSVSDQALTASFTADPQSGEAPLKVEFDASDSVDPDGNIEIYEWDFDGDGEYDDDAGIKATYEFEKIGRYKVGLRITNNMGDYETSEKEIIVEEKKEAEAVISILDEPSVFITGVAYTFKADESTSPKGAITKYEWDFGDGSKVETTKTIAHSFASAGTYEVTLKVTDEEGLEGEVKKTINVQQPQGTPKAKITTEPSVVSGSTLEGKAPFVVIFDASSSTDSDGNIVDYEWDFDGDGTIDGYGSRLSHTFQNEGIFNVKVSVIDANDNVGTAVQIVDVLPKGIDAVLKADEVEGSVPLTVTFDASGSTYENGQITSYQWDFGDGTAPKLGTASITHKYTQIGTFTAKVTVIGADNQNGTAEIIITIREIPLQACFKSVFEKGPAPLTTTFDPGCSSGTITSYLWNFGDGETSTEVKPSHVFQNAGDYDVVLEVTDSENTISKATVKITVTE